MIILFNTDFPSQFAGFYLVQNQLALLKVRSFVFLSFVLFVCLQTVGSNNSFTLIENKFEFKVTVQYDLWHMHPIVTP